MCDIKELKKEPNEDIIDMLEKLLREAKNGEIQSLACAGTTDKGDTFNCFVAGANVMPVVAEILILLIDFITTNVDLRSDDC